MIAMEQQALLQSWMAKNPGLDPGAMRDKIQSMASEGRMNALLASGMNGNPAALDEAEKLLGGSGSGNYAGGSSAPVTSSAKPSVNTMPRIARNIVPGNPNLSAWMMRAALNGRKVMLAGGREIRCIS